MGYYVVISPMDLQCLSHWPRLLQLNVHQFVRMLTDVCTYTVHYTLSAYRRVGLFFVLERILLFFATPNPVDLCCYAITIFFFFSNVVQLLDPLLLWVFSIFFFLFLSLILSVQEQTYFIPIHVYADMLVTISWYVHMKELQSISSHQMNIIYVCVCAYLFWFIPFLFVVEIVFHYLSVNAEVNENEFFGGFTLRVEWEQWDMRTTKIYNWFKTNKNFKDWVNGMFSVRGRESSVSNVSLFTISYLISYSATGTGASTTFNFSLASLMREKSSLTLAFYELKL